MCTSHVVTAIYQFVKLQASLQSCVRFFEITDVNVQFQHSVCPSTGITVGYNQTDVTILEGDEVAQLTVATSILNGRLPAETSFFLLLNSSDGSATGFQ